MQNEEPKTTTTMTVNMDQDTARTPAPRVGDGKVATKQAKTAEGTTPASRREVDSRDAERRAHQQVAGRRQDDTVRMQDMEDARKQRDGRGGAPSGATSDSRDMSSEEIRAMLVAVRIEAHAAARVARRAAAVAAARAPRVPYVSKAAAEADARAQRRRAAVVLQAACRGHLARGVAMRRRERWTIAVRCAEQRLGRSALTQWRAACKPL